MAGMPKMQEHFSAMAMDGRYAGPPVLPAPADTSHIPVGRKCRSNFRPAIYPDFAFRHFRLRADPVEFVDGARRKNVKFPLLPNFHLFIAKPSGGTPTKSK
jgi:hypothetical protein